MKARSFFRLFVTTTNQPSGAPFIDRGFTREIDGPKRTGKCLVIRSPFARKTISKALCLGLWSA